ncbi:TolC family protein [Wandonia haliotis]|uniref:TolC family protein n=2 Tax=Wandonia haliotis TaxID=574963 RepID=A0ABP3Y0S2_9FLAO
MKVDFRDENKYVPESYAESGDTTNIVDLSWRDYFSDANLIALIDTALVNNQELNITMQEIAISQSEIKARKGEYLPFVGLKAGAGLEKEGEYTRHGAVDEQLEIEPGKSFPNPFSDFGIGVYASWEIDVWKKLRNAKKAAVSRYLSSVEGRNFMVTNLISEIAESYYELMALDNLLDIVERNIEIQGSALQTVKQQKEAAKVTQLAVNRFEAQLLNTKNLQYEIRQRIVETENKINFLVGRFPQPIVRDSESFDNLPIGPVQEGIPSQLLENRPDIRQAELELMAAKLDVKVARANFYPSFKISGGVGLQAFNPAHLIKPESIFYNLLGDLIAPLINRNALKAQYASASAKQIQAIYEYEQTILSGYIDVLNQLAKIDNFSKSYETKAKEVELLNQSVTIANNLFTSARADYAEVLLTQREAVESRIELIEIKLQQMNAKINIYRALGGGWE